MRFYDLNEMRRRLAELDAERDPLVKLIAAAEAYEEREKGPAGINATPPPKRTPTQPGKTVLQITEDTALERISATGSPVQTREVIEIMRERGLPLPNKNLTNVISARLSNSGRLEGRRGFGWWPTGRPWPDEQPSLRMSGDVVPPARQNENGEADASPETGEPDSPVETQSAKASSGDPA